MVVWLANNRTLNLLNSNEQLRNLVSRKRITAEIPQIILADLNRIRAINSRDLLPPLLVGYADNKHIVNRVIKLL